MPGLNDPDRRQDVDRTEAPSRPSAADDTGAAAPTEHLAAGPALGPPVEPGEVGTLGPYRLVKELGKGGMGAVYAALDTRLHRRLALKLMLPQFAADPDARDRFLREARACAQVIHDNVVTVYDADVRDGVPYIAMQFLEGYPLDEFLRRKGSPTLQQVVRIGREAALGLAAAHAKGLVHRDIKPANLWLEAPHGRVKVLDFGLARPVDAEAEITKQGAIVGTPAYMSPEQARGLRVDHRTDLFSLGAVLYRLCTGRLPFQGESTMAVLMALGTEEPPAVRELNPGVPVALADLIHQLLSKVPANRPPSADDVAARLRAIAQATVPDAPGQVSAAGSVPQVVYVPLQVSAASSANPFADLDVTEGDDVPTAAPVGAKPRGRTLLAAAGVAALVLVFAAVVVVIRSRDAAVTKADSPDSPTATTKGKAGKGGAPPGPVVPDTSADRKVAEWVLGQGGRVRVNGGDKDIAAVVDLPRSRFILTTIAVEGESITDEGLANLRGCTGLTTISLRSVAVGGVGLAHLAGGVVLDNLDLSASRVSDAGLAHLQALPGVKSLQLVGTAVTDAGLAQLAAVKGLATLNLHGTAVTDAGLTHLEDIPVLEVLTLGDTRVTDAGLAELAGQGRLAYLGVSGTKVTPKGVADFHAALPTCRVDHDGGTLAAVDVDRIAAGWVLGLGGYVQVRGVDDNIRAVTDLPKDRFALTGISLGTATVADADLVRLEHCRSLTQFSAVGPNGSVTLAGLARLKGYKGISRIDLTNRSVTDADLTQLKNLPELTILTLDASAVTDAGVIHFKSVPRLSILSLGGTTVTDAALPTLAECRKLTTLGVRGTKVTPGGLAEFQKLAPYCRVEHDGGTLEPIDVDRRAAERAIALGGEVRVNNDRRVLKSADQLPAGPLTLNYVVLTDKPVVDADLAAYRFCTNCTKLKEIHLTGTKVTDAGLAAFERCADLHQLSLGATAVTDAGLAHFRKATGLWYLNLADTAVTDAGLDHLRQATKLGQVHLRRTRVTGPGLAAIGRSPELVFLDLTGSPVTDPGLTHLHGCKSLRWLHVGGTQVSPAGVEAFRKAVPACRVYTGANTSLDPLDPDRPAAEWVLSLGGRVWLKDKGEVAALAELLAEPFAVRAISLEGKAVTAVEMANLKGLTSLEGVNLVGTRVTDDGLAHLQGLPKLTEVLLNGAPVTDSGLMHLRACSRLTTLRVVGTKVTPAGAAAFHAAVPGCRVEYEGGVIEPKK